MRVNDRNIRLLNSLVNKEVVKSIKYNTYTSEARPEYKEILLESREVMLSDAIIPILKAKYKYRFKGLFKKFNDEFFMTLMHEFSHLLTLGNNPKEQDRYYAKYKAELTKCDNNIIDYRDITFEAVADHVALALIDANYDYIMGNTDIITEEEVTRNRDIVERMRAEYIKY